MGNEDMYPKIIIAKDYIQLEYGDLIGITDFNNNIIIPMKNYEWFLIEDDLIFVKDYDSDWEVYYIENKTVCKLEYEDITYEEDEYVMLKIEGHWVLCDLTWYFEVPEDEVDE